MLGHTYFVKLPQLLSFRADGKIFHRNNGEKGDEFEGLAKLKTPVG